MHATNRRSVLVALSACVAGCAINPPASYYQPPPLIPIQDPLPGHGIVYLLRAPHDPETLAIQLNTQQPFRLEPSTYTVLVLKPGDYAMRGTEGGLFGRTKEAFAPVSFRIHDGQRAFLYVSGITDTSVFINSIVPLSKGAFFVDGGLRPSTAFGTRSWKECSELDAQGFMSASKLKLIE